MTTQNIISTPEITGNIGSCKSNKILVYGDMDLFTVQTVQVVTNSCTGNITEYHSWQFTSFFAGIVAVSLLMLFVAFISWLDK